MSIISTVLERLGFGSPIEQILARAAHDGQRANELIIVDIRDASEWEQTGTPQGSHRISASDSDFTETVKQLVDGTPTAIVAVSCFSGMRSTSTIKSLRKSLNADLRTLKGGFQAWTADGLPIDP